MKSNVMNYFGLVLCLAFSSNVGATSTFFVESNSYPIVDPNKDLSWQSAVGGNFIELDLDNIDPLFAIVDQLQAGSVTIDLGLSDGSGGTASTVETFPINGIGVSSYGTVSGTTLINRASGSKFPFMTFSFSDPVLGFGAWVFDDDFGSQEYRMLVTEVGGGTSTSSILDSGDPCDDIRLCWFVEGFLGVTSDIGITDVAIEVLDTNLKFVEIDHLQIATTSSVPEPTTLALLGLAGFGFGAKRKN